MINSDGTLFAPHILVSEQVGTVGTAGAQTAPDVAALSDGGWVITWQDNDGVNDNDVLASIYNADSSFRTGFIKANGGAGNDILPTVAPITGGFVLIWSQSVAAADLDMFAQRYDLAGVPIGGVFDIDSIGTISGNADAVGLPNGGFAVAFEDNNFAPETDITFKTYDAAGISLSFVTANGPGGFVGGLDGNQREPALDVLSNGFIQVSWTNDFAIDSSDTVDTAVWSGSVPLSLIINAPGVALSSQNQSALAGLPLGKFSLAGHDTGGTSDITG